MPVSQERRAHPRSPCKIPVMIVSDDFAWRGTILDYSENGALIIATLQPGIGSTLVFQFQRPDDSTLIEVQGEVKRPVKVRGSSPDELGFGVQFDELLSEVESMGGAKKREKGRS